jgi:hypothetical protein
MNLSLGSSDITALLSGKNTKGHQELFQRFVSDEKPYYNAYESPINACRIGAILEDKYTLLTEENVFTQYKVSCKEMDVFTSTLDFATIEYGKVIDFVELKTVYFPDFIELIEPLRNSTSYMETIKKKFKKYYNQVQCQLMCSDLEEANLIFLAVYSYDDTENWEREIQPNEYAKFRIYRDEKVINEIKERGKIFQDIKDYFRQYYNVHIVPVGANHVLPFSNGHNIPNVSDVANHDVSDVANNSELLKNKNKKSLL